MQKWKQAAAIAATAAATAGFASAKDVVAYQVVLTEDGKMVSRSTIFGDFGKHASVEMSGRLRYDAVASAPGKDGLSDTAVKIYMFQDGEMKFVKELKARTDLAKGPALEYEIPDKKLKFTVTARVTHEPE